MTTPNLKTPPLTFPVGVTHMNVTGEFIYLLTSTGAAGVLTVAIDDGDALRLDAGQEIRVPGGRKFSKLTFNNTSGGSIDVLIAVGEGSIRIASSVTILGTTTVNQTKSATFNGINRVTIDTVSGGGFLKQIAPAAGTRRSLSVTADPGNNAAGIVVGGLGSTGATQGTLVQPGQSFPVDSGGEVWAYATVNTDKVWLSETKD